MSVNMVWKPQKYYIYHWKILDNAGIIMDEEGNPAIPETTSDSGATIHHAETSSNDELKDMTLEELNQLLNDVLEQEDYIKAIAIRDEINSRKK